MIRTPFPQPSPEALHAVDRLSRDTDHAGWVATEVKDAGALVVDASKPEAEWIAKMFGRMQAEAYLEAPRKNTVRALALKKSRNERVGSIPFGYRFQEDGVHLDQDPEGFKAICRILELGGKGLGGRKIAAALTSEGFKPRGVAWIHGNLHTLATRWLAKVGNLPKTGFGLIGVSGGGKTQAVAALLKLMIVNNVRSSAPIRGLLGLVSVSWGNVFETVGRWRLNPLDEEIPVTVERLCRLPLIILDDVGREITRDVTKDRANGLIDLIVTARDRGGLPTIWTSNLNAAELIERYGASMFRRLVRLNPVIDLGELPLFGGE